MSNVSLHMSPWETILLAIGGNAALLAVLGWLARSLLGQLAAKDLERFKSELASASNTAAEQLRHELHLVAQESQILLSKLHKRRAQVVAEAYGLLVEAQWAAQDFVSLVEWAGDPSKMEKYKTAMNKSAEFYRYFDRNRIYLPQPLCDQIEAFLNGMRGKVIGFGVYARHEDAALPDSGIQKKYEAWDKASDYFSNEVPKTRAALEEELRSIIGGVRKNAS